jgi:ABC-2 type transport system ATP-binding protein
MQSTIEIDGLRKAYGDVEAVRDISFSVAAGEVFCLLGPNGAGKTTTTEILEGHAPAAPARCACSATTPRTASERCASASASSCRRPAAQAELTVAEVLTMYGRYYPRRRPVGELVELVGLAGKEAARQAALGGQRRLDLALALVGDPDLLSSTSRPPASTRPPAPGVVDDQDLCALGRPSFTTHFMDEAQALADRVAVMVDGRIVALGTPAEIGGRDRRRPRSPSRCPQGVGLATCRRSTTPGPRETAGRVRRHPRACDPPTPSPAGRSSAASRACGFAVSQPSLEDVYLRLTEKEATSR